MKKVKIVRLFLIFQIILISAHAQESRPELIVQTAHSLPVNDVAYSPDGRFIASGGNDGTVKLWDAATGAELRTFYGHPEGLAAIAFSPDGAKLATASDKSFAPTIIVWDTVTGAELLRENEIFGDVTAMNYRADGVLLSLDVLDDEMNVWDVAAKKEIVKIPGDYADKLIDVAAFSADGKLFAFVENKKIISLRETATGKELRRLDKHHDEISSLVFSSDSQFLASTGSEGIVKLWDTSNGKDLYTFQGGKDIANQNELFQSASFNHNNSKLVVGSNQAIKIWDLKKGTLLRSIALTDDIYVRSIVFSPDDKMVCGGVSSSRLKIWDAVTGATILAMPEDLRVSSNRDVTFSPNGNSLVTHVVGDNINFWDMNDGLPKSSLKAGDDKHLAYSADGKMTAYSDGSAIKLRDAETGKIVREIKASMKNFLAFSSDGKIIGGQGLVLKKGDPNFLKDALILYDVATGAELLTLPDVHRKFVFSPNGELIAAPLGVMSKAVRIWEVKTGKEVKTIIPNRFTTYAVAFSPDGKTLATGGYKQTVKLWDTATWTEKAVLPDSQGVFDVLTFNPDGNLLAGSGSDSNGEIRVWEMTTQKELFTAEGHAGGTDKIAFHPGGKFFVSVGKDTKIKFWNAHDGQLLATLIEFDNGGWVTTDVNGLFDGSSKELKQLLWRLSPRLTDVVPLEAFFKEFYYPGLLQEILAGKLPQPPNKDLSQVDIRQPQVKINGGGNQATASLNTVAANKQTVRVEITDNVKPPARPNFPPTGGAQDVRLFRNGSLVKVWRGDVLQGKGSVMLEATVPIVAGANVFTAYAFNHDNVKSEDATQTLTVAESLKRKGIAYILAVGVNEYANAQYNLKYAVADAQDFSAEIKRQQEQLKNYERVEIIQLFNQDASKERILQALTALQGRTQPEDAVIVYFAGHGAAQQQKFYLIPHDLGYDGDRKKLTRPALDLILAHSISDRELELAFETIDAGQLVLVIDACNSGQALEAEEKRRGPMNSKGLAQLAYEKGMYILTAAQSYQAALEASKLGHGYLTFALIEEGIKQGAADTEPKDGLVQIREWFNYATARVPQMQEEKFQQATDEKGRVLEQEDVAFVEGEESIRVPKQRSVQRPRLFYRRELETQPLIISRQ